jgi:hypothetical protein
MGKIKAKAKGKRRSSEEKRTLPGWILQIDYYLYYTDISKV